MLTIIHGDHIEASRNELNRLKSTFVGKEVRFLDGKNIDEAFLRQALESSSLFGGDNIVVLENLFTPLGKKTSIQKQYAKILNESEKDVSIILWEPKELSKTLLGLFPEAHDNQFSLPKLLFTFLDSIKPANIKHLLFLYHDLHTQEASELIFYMLASRVRQLIAAKSNVLLPKMNSWQMSRLTNQSRFFTMEQLTHMHKNILSREFALKTGTTPFTLSQHIEQILTQCI